MTFPFFSTSLLTDEQCDELAGLFARSAGVPVRWQHNDHGSIGFYADAPLSAMSAAVIANTAAHKAMYRSRPGAAPDPMWNK